MVAGTMGVGSDLAEHGGMRGRKKEMGHGRHSAPGPITSKCVSIVPSIHAFSLSTFHRLLHTSHTSALLVVPRASCLPHGKGLQGAVTITNC
jgi:hypothetical protein